MDTRSEAKENQVNIRKRHSLEKNLQKTCPTLSRDEGIPVSKSSTTVRSIFKQFKHDNAEYLKTLKGSSWFKSNVNFNEFILKLKFAEDATPDRGVILMFVRDMTMAMSIFLTGAVEEEFYMVDKVYTMRKLFDKYNVANLYDMFEVYWYEDKHVLETPKMFVQYYDAHNKEGRTTAGQEWEMQLKEDILSRINNKTTMCVQYLHCCQMYLYEPLEVGLPAQHNVFENAAFDFMEYFWKLFKKK